MFKQNNNLISHKPLDILIFEGLVGLDQILPQYNLEELSTNLKIFYNEHMHSKIINDMLNFINGYLKELLYGGIINKLPEIMLWSEFPGSTNISIFGKL